MIRHSTSLFNINGDKKMDSHGVRLYMLLNRLRNTLPRLSKNNNFTVEPFRLNKLERYWPQVELTSSPSRTLSNLFWLSLPWQKIQEELGGINIFDAGCGSGNYSRFLEETAGVRLKKYTGTDIKQNPNWKKLSEEFSHFHFIEADSASIDKIIPSDTNLFISQSAIEHFPKDLLFFSQIRDFIQKHRRPTLQIHLFPSAACLRLYRCHGYRQYTPRTINPIARLFKSFSQIKLISLGGSESLKIHEKYIFEPKYILRCPDKRTDNAVTYNNELLDAVKKDMATNCDNPAFYALIIQSFPQHKLFP